MANVNSSAGLVPVRYRNGTPWNGGGNLYYIPASDTNSYASGDPVTMTGSGDANGVAAVTLATAGVGDLVLGPIVGMGASASGAAYVDPNSPNAAVIPATKAHAYYVLVLDDPNVIFEILDAGDGTPLSAANIGMNANLKANANNGFTSGWQVSDVGVGTGATNQLKLLGLKQVSGNAFGQYARWLVTINNHQFAAGTAGV